MLSALAGRTPVAAVGMAPPRGAGDTSLRLMPEDGLSLFLPAHNEAANLRRLLPQAVSTLAAATRAFEIIVVDDGSTDGTADVVRAFTDTDPRVRLAQHARNLGYGAAVRTGFAESRFPWIFFTDADCQFDVGELPRLFPPAADADLVAGYRQKRRDPWHRRVNAAMYGFAVRRLLGVRVRDVDCAFKLVGREVTRHVALTSNGALVSAELLAKAVHAGYGIAEVGVHHYPRTEGRQSGASPRVVLRAMRQLIQLSAGLGRGGLQKLEEIPCAR